MKNNDIALSSKGEGLSRPRALVQGRVRSAGRNSAGRITSRHRSAGKSRLYRKVDFRRHVSVGAKVLGIEYDPNRTAFIALMQDMSGTGNDEDAVVDKDIKAARLFYIIAHDGLKVGDVLWAGMDAEVQQGNFLPLSSIPTGSLVSCLEMKPGKGAQIARSAGVFVRLMSKENGKVLLKLPSGLHVVLPESCSAMLGRISNPKHCNERFRNAGHARRRGRRPSVRGVAMNPVDHPLGGGEGKSSGGRHPVSPTGVKSKGYKTLRSKSAKRRAKSASLIFGS